MKKIFVFTFFLLIFLFFSRYPHAVRAIVNEPCKVCVGTTCTTQASPPNCTNRLNECTNNYDCGYVAPYCSAANNRDCACGCTPTSGGGYCNSCATPPPGCTNGDLRCSGNNSQICVGGSWVTSEPCVYGCSGGVCITPYCVNEGCGTCSSCQNQPGCQYTWVDCYSSKASMDTGGPRLSHDCLLSTSCSTTCHPTVDTCQVPPSIDCPALGYPGQVAHIDNCGGVGCGPPCGGGGGGCTATTPSNISVTRISPTKATLTWNPGSGIQQQLRIGANLTEVNGGCPGLNSPACVVNLSNLPMSQTSYTTGDVLSPGTVYYWEVVSYNSASCNKGSTRASLSSCQITPNPVTVQPGNAASLSTNVNSSVEISSVNFSSGNTAFATVNPASDNTYVYQTTLTGVAAGSTTANANVIIGGGTDCTATTAVDVAPLGPWWQVTDADVATNSDLNSKVPAGKFFGTIGTGGYPGIPAYGGTTNLAAGKISTNGWVAASNIGSTKAFDYNFFSQAIPSNTVINAITTPAIDGSFFASGGTSSYGFYWYKFDGTAGATSGLDLTITNPASIGSRKVVLLVGSANLNLKGNINLTKGQGFFMAIVGKDAGGNKGKITVDPTVGGGGTNLEGIYFADGTISTGTTGAKNDSQLKFRGSVSANGGINLQRDLGLPANTTTPAEVFEYAPDQIMLFPKVLGVRKINWKEVAP